MTTRTHIMIKGEEKKHSVKYEEKGDPSESDADATSRSLTGTIYVRKTALPRPYPSELTLTLEWKD